MKLQELFRYLLSEGAPFFRKQKELAQRIGITPSSVSRIANNAPEWEEHFEAFLAVVKLCRELGIDPFNEKPHPLSLVKKKIGRS